MRSAWGPRSKRTDPDAAALSVLHWLGWLQEEILRAVQD